MKVACLHCGVEFDGDDEPISDLDLLCEDCMSKSFANEKESWSDVCEGQHEGQHEEEYEDEEDYE